MTMKPVHLALPVLALAALAALPALSQGAPPAATITQAPSGGGTLAPTDTAPPAARSLPSGAPGALPPAAPGQSAALPTLVPDPGDTSDVDEVVLPAKPVLIMSGQSNWENGLKTMRATFAHIREEAAKAGLTVAGRPVTVFSETSDDNFKYDAMIPVARAPEPGVAMPAEIRAGTTPSGKAYRFVHKGPYDEIDSTYETITAYLDAKDIQAKDAFVEEYVTDAGDPTDPSLEINIFVQPK
jgi:effector-binding domain-containing protein